MGKNRDILDYAALGAELIQTSQLSSMRQTLAGLSALQLQKIEAEQREERSRLQEEKVREFVFQSMKLIDADGDRHAAKKPMRYARRSLRSESLCGAIQHYHRFGA